jgi:glutathione S-transferase
LDQMGQGRRFIPATGSSRWRVLRRQAQADGLMEATFLLAMETMRRSPHERSLRRIDKQCATITRAVVAFEDEIGDFELNIDLGHIALGCALSYLDLRATGHLSWRNFSPKLAQWFEVFQHRSSMQSTRMT